MTTYPVGAFFVTTVSGLAGFGIGVGQALAGDPSRWEHAGVVVGADGATVEAQPGGAVLGNVSAYAGRLLISDGPVQEWMARYRKTPFADDAAAYEQRLRNGVATEGRKLIGTPYSALDYFALAALHLHLPSTWIRNRVKASGHLICSQLVDLAYQRAGIQLFDDGRLPGDVMPADLAAWAEDYKAGAS